MFDCWVLFSKKEASTLGRRDSQAYVDCWVVTTEGATLLLPDQGRLSRTLQRQSARLSVQDERSGGKVKHLLFNTSLRRP
jgi:hypothetical protein